MYIKLTQQKFKIDSVNTCKLHYQFLLKKYLKYVQNREISEEYAYRLHYEAKKFLIYLFSRKIQSVSQITNEDIYSYISTLEKYSPNMRYETASKIRIFFKFLYINSFTKLDLSFVVPKVKINHNNIPSNIWTSEEIETILNIIDRNTSIGKRDYAIVMIMTMLGLRFADIKELKFENIDWQKNIISIVQSKTNKIVTLPLLNNIGLALIDYIKNGRPNVKSEYIFLHSNQKIDKKYKFNSTFRKYLKLANINISNRKYIGPYSLRHSLATTLLQNKTPLSTISEILGHTDIDNTAIYLKVDISSLRECCLDLEVD